MGTSLSSAVGLLAALGLGTLATSALARSSARDPAIDLAWTAPPDCPTASQVLADVRSLVGHRDVPATRSPIAVDGSVARLAPNRWRLTLAIGGARRELEAASCAELARAGALFLALLVDPTGTRSATNIASEDSVATAPQPPADPSPLASTLNVGAARPETAVDPRPPHPREVSMLVAAGIVLDLGTLPHATLLGVVGVGIRYRRVDVTLDGAVGPPQDTTVDGSAGARLVAVNATWTPCYAAWWTRRLRLEPCLPIEVGWIHGEGIGISQSRSADAVRLSLGGELALLLSVGDRFEVRADVAVLLPVVRPDFELAGLGSVFHPGIAVRGGTAALVRF